jgi:hypothetical protein
MNPAPVMLTGVHHAAGILLLVVRRPKAFATCAVSLYMLTPTIRRTLRYAASWLTARVRATHRLSVDNMRTTFNDTVIVTQAPTPGHTHAESAAARSTATGLSGRVALSMGLTPYYFQMSRADQRAHRSGSRNYYWTKDLTVEPAFHNPPADSMLTLIDVDYYVDMDEFLTEQLQPVFLYTFVPEQVADQQPGYSFTFDQDNNVVYSIAGGEVHKHPLWQYGVSHVLATRTFFGIPYLAHAYLVDRRQIAPHRYAIFLTPYGSWRGLAAVLVSYLRGSHLRRLIVAEGEYTRLEVHGPKGHHRSTGRVSSYHQACITAAEDDAIAAVARVSKTDLSIPQVQSHVQVDRAAAVALVEYHRNSTGRKPDSVFPVESGVRTYQFSPPSYDPDAKPTLVPFMAPLLPECYAPASCLHNEQVAVDKRITSVAAKALRMTPFLSAAIQEFLALLLPTPGQLHPKEQDEVYDRQARPSQRRLLDEACVAGEPERRVEAFVKKEAYDSPKDPRIISTINPVDKLAYSAFIYSFADVLADQPWYAFSKTPSMVAARVATIMQTAHNVASTDFSRFDGRVSNILRELEKFALLRAFHSQYHDRLMTLHRSQYTLPGTTTFGVKYETGTSRASGSPETSAFNTLANAFVAFLALRQTREHGAYIAAPQAFARLGVYGGDDGLTTNIDPRAYHKAAADVGQVITLEPATRGPVSIKFLARVYSPAVWHGDPNSCCDLPRQLSKFHATRHLPANVTASDKLREKIRGFLATDANTPVIGPFVKAVAKHATPVPLADAEPLLLMWGAEHDPTVQYPNEYGSWMEAYAATALAGYDFERFNKWISEATSLEYLLNPPVFIEPKPPTTKQPVVVDGELALPPAPLPAPPRALRVPRAQRRLPPPRPDNRPPEHRRRGNGPA